MPSPLPWAARAGVGFFLVVGSLSLPQAPTFAEETAPPLIFLLGGQSNMHGMASASDLPTKLRTLPPNVAIHGRSAMASPPLHSNFGPEISLAHRLAEAHPDREIHLIKTAEGGASMAAWARSYDPAAAAAVDNEGITPCYATLLREYRLLTARIGAHEIGGFFWMQGEQDAAHPAAALHYGANLRNLLAALREDLGSPTMPAVICRISPPEKGHSAVAQVRQAQAAVAASDPRVRIISTDDLSRPRGDPLHFDGPGLILLGDRMADAYFDLTGE